MKDKTIAQILKKCKEGDTLKAGKRYWKVIYSEMDECTIAYPVDKNGTYKTGSFELWSEGIESVAIIPGLQVIKK